MAKMKGNCCLSIHEFSMMWIEKMKRGESFCTARIQGYNSLLMEKQAL